MALEKSRDDVSETLSALRSLAGFPATDQMLADKRDQLRFHEGAIQALKDALTRTI